MCPCKLVGGIVVVLAVVLAAYYYLPRRMEGFIGECGQVCADCLTKPGFVEGHTKECVECQLKCPTGTVPASASNPSGIVQAVAQPLLK